MTPVEAKVGEYQRREPQRAHVAGFQHCREQGCHFVCKVHERPTRGHEPRHLPSAHAETCPECLAEATRDLAEAEGAAWGRGAATALAPVIERLDKIVAALERNPESHMQASAWKP